MPDADRRRTFLPVVGAGVAAGALAAVAGSRAWASGFDAGTQASVATLPGVAETGESPLAASLSLVALACWGVLLVTRGLVRRATAALAALAAAGLLATVVVGFSGVQDQVLDAMRESGATSDTLGTRLTGWYWAAGAAAVVLLVAAVLAVAWCPAWPEMGSRYDAPGSAPDEPAGDVPPEEQSNLDLWKSLDEGRDPTT